jgi:FtsH-binding integral membrane protein
VTASEQPTVRRSRFVSIVAWLGIISGAFGTLGSISFAVAQPGIRSAIFLLSTVALFVTALGLRARREWARQGFILVLAYTAVMGIIGARTTRPPRLSDYPSYPGVTAPKLTQEQLDAMWSSMRTSMLVMAVMGAALDGLVILAFSSKKIRREFGAESAA